MLRSKKREIYRETERH